MALHPDFPKSPYNILDPELRWFPADEALREAVETIIYLYDVVSVKDKYDLLRFDSSGAVSGGMIFPFAAGGCHCYTQIQ